MSSGLAAVLLVFLLGVSAPAMTLQDLRNESRRIGMDSGSRLRFSTAAIDSWLGEAQRVATMETKALRRGYTFTTLANTTYYAMPSDFLQVERATVDNQELTEITPIALSNMAGRKWADSHGYTTHYYINFSSRGLMGIYPVPANSSSTGTIRVEYYAQPGALSAGTDVPFNGVSELVPYHYILAYYAAFQMAVIDGRADMAALYRTFWVEGIQRMQRESTNRPSYRPSLSPSVSPSRIGP